MSATTFVIAFAIVACGGSASTDDTEVSMDAVPSVTAATTIWFGPEPPLPLGSSTPHQGSLDYMDLFRAPERWASAAREISVFKVNAAWLEKVASRADVELLVRTLQAKGIRIALEVNGLSRPPHCGGHGFSTRDLLAPLRRIQEANGKVSLLVLNEPYAWASRYTGDRACRWPPERVAGELAHFARAARAMFPDIRIGAVEPLWQNIEPQDLIDWVDLLNRDEATRLAFFHLDPDYARSDWVEKSRIVEAAIRERGIPFGIHYRGERTDSSDAGWLDSAAARVRQYEVEGGGRPDHALLQSWHPYPNFLLPDSESATFTGFVRRYAEFRRSGAPAVARASLLSPIVDQGRVVISGVVPAGARRAIVGLQFDRRCTDCAGLAEVVIHRVDVRVPGSDNRVPNGDLTNGSTSWVASGPVAVEYRDGALLVTLRKPESAVLNSAPFFVEPGERFVATLEADVRHALVKADTFRVVFLAEREISRLATPLMSPAHP